MGFLGFMYRQRFSVPKPVPSSVDLAGQTALITGANAGLGLEASRQLIGYNISRIILGVRDVKKGEVAKAELAAGNPDCTIEVWPIDMESLVSIGAFAERAHGLDRLDIAILNAGVKKLEFATSSAGHEISVQVNHLGTALLSLLLLPTLKRTASAGKPTRMTIVASEVHMWTPFKERGAESILRRMDEKDSFAAPERYNTSKLLNVLWSRELASKVAPEDVIFNYVNPGYCLSSLHREETSAAFTMFAKLFAWTPAQGAHCLVDAVAVQGVESHGKYLSEQKVTPPSAFVRSAEGQKTQAKLFKETMAFLQEEVTYLDLSACWPHA